MTDTHAHSVLFDGGPVCVLHIVCVCVCACLTGGGVLSVSNRM